MPVPFSPSGWECKHVTMAATIRDVAQRAGVSAATVSRVYNGTGVVSSETQQRVLSAALELRYVPNATARSLSTSKTRVLGFVPPVPHGEFFAELMRGVDEAAIEAGYSLLTSATHHRLDQAARAMHLMQGRVDGLILAAPETTLSALMEILPASLPLVWLLFDAEDGADCVRVDNLGGARCAVQHLIDLGHRRIGHVVGRVNNWDASERLEGYRSVLRENGIAHVPELEVQGDFNQPSGYMAARKLLGLPERPTAIFAANDQMAAGVLHALHEAGVSVPDEMAVIGFDGMPSAVFTTPSLSTIYVPVYEMGRMAAQRLIARLEGSPGYCTETTVVRTELIARASTVGVSATLRTASDELTEPLGRGVALRLGA